MNERKFLLVNPNGTSRSVLNTIKQSLEPRGWCYENGTSYSECQKIINGHTLYVGVVLLDATFDKESIKALERFLGLYRNMGWLAVIEPSLLKRKDLVELIAQSFFDYHTLPIATERLIMSLGHAFGMAQLIQRHGHAYLPPHQDKSSPLIGESPAMLDIKRQICKISVSDAPVLITGESGTGKELVAKSIHNLSSRPQDLFVAVNCGALPDNLVQAELFGHEKGAFTGAHQRKIGKIELSNHGTLLLDEVGDLPTPQQVNFLRFLQEGVIERVGGRTSIPIDSRIIAATHVNLEEAVHLGRFREDLYYRLNVLTIHVPPLRERPQDVELLANLYFQKYAEKYNNHVTGFTQEAVTAMKEHHWPGNVRELINRVRRAIVMSDGKLIRSKDLGLNTGILSQLLPSLSQARAEAERDVIEKSLLINGHNISKAARLLKVSRLTLYRLMEKHNLRQQKSDEVVDLEFNQQKFHGVQHG